MLPALLLWIASSQEELRLQAELTKGQKYAVTSDLEFVGDPSVLKFFGPATLHAALDVEVQDAATTTARFLELSGKGNVKPAASRWNYDLLWKAGSPARRTVIGHLPLEETEAAAAALEGAFKAAWTVKPKGLGATLEGKPESFAFLEAWSSSLFLLPAPLPFAARSVKKGQTFEEGGFAWTVEAVESKRARLVGKGKDRTVTLGVDAGGISSLDLEIPGKTGEVPALKAVLKAGRKP